jgi:3-oxoacyl-[acyl-carrier-protein] synthase II
MRRVVITGAGVISPIGNDLESFWSALLSGQSGAAPITRFDTEGFATTFACELKNFNPSDFLRKPEIRRMDLFCQYGMIVAEMALQNSNIDLSKVDLNRFGVIMASGIGGLTSIESAHSKYLEKGPKRIPPMFIPMMIADILPGQVAMKFGLKGPNYGTVSACASSSHAVGNAMLAIRSGMADLVLTGGSEASITPLGVGGFNALQAISTRNDSPETASRPFDKDRDGFVMGEGGTALVLEELEHAKARGANILCEVRGAGYTADAHHLTAPAPEGEGAQRAMHAAVEMSGLDYSQIGHINTHGTSTPAGDIAEIQALKKVFGNHSENLLITSTKSMTGHLLGAAGAIESLATAMAIHHGIVPATINLENPDPELVLPILRGESQKADLQAAVSNTFGFGGHNASLVLAKLDA